MKRDLTELSRRRFDLVVVGGGIFGACAALDAVQRGLSVVLLERGDFGGATSANSFKMVHGGIRYLQHADIYRVRQSSHERRALLRTAPHLVRPLPIVIPTYGHGMKSKGLLRAALGLYDLLTCDRNRGIDDPNRRIPSGEFLTRSEVLDMFPGLHQDGLTGAAVFRDGQMYNPPRLVLAFVQSACAAGALVANYAEVTRFLRHGDRITGVQVRDGLTGDSLEVRSRMVLNAAGPYAEKLIHDALGVRIEPKGTYSRDTAFVVPRPLLSGDHAVAVQGATKDPDAVLSRGERHLFVVPWRSYTLVGVWHGVYKGHPDKFTVTEAELQSYLDEVNAAYPALALTLDDISLWNAGLVPFGENREGAKDLSYGKRSRLVDHAVEHGLEGLVTLIGVRFTTGRMEAGRALDLIFRKWRQKSPRCVTDQRPVHGGDIGHFTDFLNAAIRSRPQGLSEEVMRCLVHNHGSEYTRILGYLDTEPALAATVGGTNVLQAEVVNAVREEMARKLGDVVFRRTDLATGDHPGEAALRTCAELMARELGWSPARVQKEIAEVEARFPRVRRTPEPILAAG